MTRIAKIAGWFFILFIPAGLAAQNLTPRQTLDEYFRLLNASRSTEAYALLIAADREVVRREDYVRIVEGDVSREEMVQKVLNDSGNLYEFLQEGRMTYRVQSWREERGGFVFELETNSPDIFETTMVLVYANPKLQDETLSKEVKESLYAETIKRVYPGGGPPFITRTQTYRIVNEGGVWRVDAGLLARYRKAKAFRLSRRAWNAEFEGDVDLAAALYKEAHYLDPENEQISQALSKNEATLERRREELNREIEPYIKLSMVLKDVRIAEDNIGRNIVFSVENGGDRRISSIRLRILYYSEIGRLLGIEHLDYNLRGGFLKPGSVLARQSTSLVQAPLKWDGQSFKADIVEVR